MHQQSGWTATPSRLIGAPISAIPPFLHWMPFLAQPSQFILAWDRHQTCWLAYPVAWFAVIYIFMHHCCYACVAFCISIKPVYSTDEETIQKNSKYVIAVGYLFPELNEPKINIICILLVMFSMFIVTACTYLN